MIKFITIDSRQKGDVHLVYREGELSSEDKLAVAIAEFMNNFLINPLNCKVVVHRNGTATIFYDEANYSTTRRVNADSPMPAEQQALEGSAEMRSPEDILEGLEPFKA